ncbi:MAG TPA: carboxypeptidase regulatory-like domain-containing protein [Verrucomicrobiae bacterium]|nr:carboxypeptidase regulatory-like domain-containing protein [Verrucomicrobiae bacterium]
MNKSLFSVLGWMITSGLLIGAEHRPNLAGRVTLEDGSALPKATVFIYSAGPKQGTASVCPYCYPDCQKKTETASDGGFKIDSLDPHLLFRLLVVAGGYQPKFVTKVDPETAEQKIALKPISQEDLKSKTRIAGIVLVEDGKPVVGAVISPEGVERGASTQWGGTDAFVDPVAVADEKGHFLLLCKENVDSVYATVTGPSVAPRWFQFKPGRDHLVRMQGGVTVTGQVELKGKPAKGVVMGLSTTDRTCGKFFNCDELATDKDGRFLMPNVPPGREFVLYSKMDSLAGQGVTPGKVFTTGDSGTTTDVNKLTVQPGCRLAGQIVLSDGKPIPPHTRLLLSRENAWDHTEIELDSQGRFEVTGVPAEAVGISVRVKGYKFSKRNPSLHWLNGGIVGTVTTNETNLVFLLEPGEWRFNEERQDLPSGADSQPYAKPLQGAKL